uniref:Uncharacterized protein n=1 Tax=Arundo donax TaxID=35708 RepID=A0A0A9G960_ARUDO
MLSVNHLIGQFMSIFKVYLCLDPCTFVPSTDRLDD